MQTNPNTAAARRMHLREAKPFPLWHEAAGILKLFRTDSVPVAVSGSTRYDFDKTGAMRIAVGGVGRILRDTLNVSLLTGGMPAVGHDVGAAYLEERRCHDWAESNKPVYGRQLFHLLPKHRGDVTPPCGEVVQAGKTFDERQLILGMAARVCVLLGGGPGACREANATLESGGFVLPIAACGGAAAGVEFESSDPLGRAVNFDLAEQRFRQQPFADQSRRWRLLTEPVTRAHHGEDGWRMEDATMRAVRIIYTFVQRLCDAA